MNDTELEPPIGAAVFDSLGEQFAYVKDVRGGLMKLELPMARDYWLSTSHVSRIDGKDVYLDVSRHEAEDQKVPGPAD